MVSRYNIEGDGSFFYENGHLQSDGYTTIVTVDPVGEWVDYDDYEHLRKTFADYHDTVLQLLEYVLDDKVPPTDLFNKCATTHIETVHIRELLGLSDDRN